MNKKIRILIESTIQSFLIIAVIMLLFAFVTWSYNITSVLIRAYIGFSIALGIAIYFAKLDAKGRLSER